MKVNNLLKFFSIAVLIILISPAIFASESLKNEQKNIIDTLNTYYTASMEENLNKYYSIISTEGFSNEKIKERKEITKTIWDTFDTLDFSISSVIPTVEKDSAHVYYTLSSTIKDNKNQIVSTEREMVGILFKEQGTWKVWITMPRSSYELKMATYGQEMMIHTNISNEPKQTNFFQDITNKVLRKNKDPLSLPSFPKCGNAICEDGESTKTCQKDCPIIGLCIYNESKLKEYNGTKLNLSYVKNAPSFVKDSIVKNNTIVKLKIIDKNKNYLFSIIDKTIVLNKNDNTKTEPTFTVEVKSCTLKKILNKQINPLDAYQNKKIIVKGKGVMNYFKLKVASTVLNIKSWFEKDNAKEGAKYPPPLNGPAYMFAH